MWMTVTGIAGIAIAIGLQISRLAAWAAVIAAIVLCCLLPANLKAAREYLTIGGKRVLPAAPRILFQLVFITALIGSIWPNLQRTPVTHTTKLIVLLGWQTPRTRNYREMATLMVRKKPVHCLWNSIVKNCC